MGIFSNLILVILLCFSLISPAFAHSQHKHDNKISPPLPTATSLAIGGPFEMTSHLGNVVTDKTFQGKPFVVYFGFTSCPDVCPVTLSHLAQAFDMAGEKTKNIQALLVTVDPTRDTLPVLKKYVEAIHPQILGLRGTPQQIKNMLHAYKAYAAPVKSEKPEDSLMAHSDVLYLMTSEGAFYDVVSGSSTPEYMADALLKLSSK